MKERGFDVDVMCLGRSRSERMIQRFEGINIYCIQSRLSAEKSSALYFGLLAVFFVKAFVFCTVAGLLRGYRLVHVTSPPDIMVFSAAVPKLLGARIILDIHDIGPELYMRKLNVSEESPMIRVIRFMERISAHFSDHVITVTHPWKDALVSRSVSENKCTVLLNVPDENIFRPLSPRTGKNGESFHLYYHGSMEEHFGVDTMIQAMPTIRRHIPNVTLHIYRGKKGRLDDQLSLEVRRLKLDGMVRFYDAVPFYELPQILANADIGVVPTKGSVFSDTALSMKSLEYMALGIPIVISKTKVHGLYYDSSMVRFFEPENSHDLAMSVIGLYDDEEEGKRLARKAQGFIKKYGWRESKKIYLDIVDTLTHKH